MAIEIDNLVKIICVMAVMSIYIFLINHFSLLPTQKLLITLMLVAGIFVFWKFRGL